MNKYIDAVENYTAAHAAGPKGPSGTPGVVGVNGEDLAPEKIIEARNIIYNAFVDKYGAEAASVLIIQINKLCV